MVIGGKAIYDAYLQQADRIYYTQVHMQPAGDVFFPLLDELVKSGWRRCSARKQGAAAKDQADMTFLQLERVKKP
jgi:dihydrofolate reductase